MSEIFADSFYYLALLNPTDEANRAAVDFTRTFQGVFVTTHWVLTEVADAMAAPANRALFLDLLQSLRGDSRVMIVSDASHLFDRGVELYARRPDKSWSMTDCTSFVVMEERRIAEALTGDHHFEQAGFSAVLK